MKLPRKLATSLVALYLCVSWCTGYSQEVGRLSEIKALGEAKEGISAEIFVVGRRGEYTWLADTSADGTAKFEPPKSCELNPRILIRPVAILRYQESSIKACGDKLIFILKRWKLFREDSEQGKRDEVINNLMLWVDVLNHRNDYGSLALVYTELAARLDEYDDELTGQLGQQAILSAGKQLGVASPLSFDYRRQIPVMSRDLRSGLEAYQKNKGLEVTGRLDGRTVQTMANAEYWTFLYTREGVGGGQGGPNPALGELDVKTVQGFASNLEAHTRIPSNRDDPALMALLYVELAQRRYSLDQVKEGREAEKRSYEFAGKVFGVDAPTAYDPTQNRWVLSARLRRALKGYQAEHGLAGAGRLDYQTLRTLSGRDIGTYLYTVPE